MRKLVLITGASAGIGEAFAKTYAMNGYDLIVSARREDRLVALAHSLSESYGVDVSVATADLSRPDAPLDLLNRIEARGRPLDAVVNNAGFGLPGTFVETSWEDQRDFLQLMLTTPTEICHRVLPGMQARGFGRIINVASLVSFLPGSKGHTLYGPVKSALMKLSESLNEETAGTGVHVTAVCPGLTYSEFHDVNGQRERVSELPDYMWQKADEVAEAGFEAVEANRPVVVTGGGNKAIAALAHVLPDPVARAAMRQQSRYVRD